MEQTSNITRFMDPIDKDQLYEVVSDGITDILWNKIFYLSSFATTTVTTSSSTEDLTARSPETSEGVYLHPDRESKLRLTFYLNTGQTNSVVYLGIASRNTASTPTAIAQPANSFVGIKVDQSVIKLCTYNGDTDSEFTLTTTSTITDNTTNLLEIELNPRQNAVIYFNKTRLGEVRVPYDFASKINTFFPYITSIKSVSGSVNLTLESYEFIQNRK